MPSGLPGFRQSQFPGEKPPTLFHPASPKEPSKEAADNASMMSTSTFSSTVSLLKENLKSKFHSSHKKSDPEKRPASKRYAEVGNAKQYSARRNTAEAYMLYATTR